MAVCICHRICRYRSWCSSEQIYKESQGTQDRKRRAHYV